MSFDSVSKSLGSVFEERLSNPLVTTFVISWSIVNWKFFVLLFSKNSAVDTFNLITKHCYPNLNDFLGWAIAAPIAGTLAYTYLLPYVSNPFLRDWRTNQQKVNGIKDTLPIEAVLTLKESLDIRKQQTELENTNNTLRTEAQGLRTQLFAAHDNIAAVDRARQDITTELENLKASMQDVRRESKSLSDDIARKETALSESKSRVAALESKVSQLKKSRDQIRTDLRMAVGSLNTKFSDKMAELMNSDSYVRLQNGVIEAAGEFGPLSVESMRKIVDAIAEFRQHQHTDYAATHSSYEDLLMELMEKLMHQHLGIDQNASA